MRILLGISVLVLVAILRTGISILRHIRLTRQRNRFLRDQQLSPQIPTKSPATAANITPLPARFAAPIVAPVMRSDELADIEFVEALAEESSRKMPIATPQQTPTLRPVPVVSRRPQPLVPTQSLPSSVEISPATATVAPPLSAPVSAATEHAPLRILEVVPTPAPQGISPAATVLRAPANDLEAPPPPAVAPPPPLSPNMRRPIRSVHSQPSGSRPAHRPDWIYFNKDMGDLSDPAPSRIRVRSR